VVSEPSSIVILSMRSQILAVAIPTSSTNPGLTPVPKIAELPSSQAARMRTRSAGLALPLMNAAVVTT